MNTFHETLAESMGLPNDYFMKPLVLKSNNPQITFVEPQPVTETTIAEEEVNFHDRFGNPIVPGVVCTYGYGPERSVGVVKQVFDDAVAFFSGLQNYQMEYRKKSGKNLLWLPRRPHTTYVRRIDSILVLPHVTPEQIGLTIGQEVFAEYV
jgi:hypothetical protein